MKLNEVSKIRQLNLIVYCLITKNNSDRQFSAITTSWGTTNRYYNCYTDNDFIAETSQNDFFLYNKHCDIDNITN